MKKILLIFPLLAITTLLTTGCPPTGGSTGNGTDTTKHDSVTPPAHDYGTAVITLERTACFGMCPDYTLKIEGNGKVSYDGHDFVKVKGPQTSQIEAKAVKELVDEFFKIDYFALKDSFVEPVTDMPTTITSLRIDGKSKQVYNYFGAPQSLKDLEAKIDQVANTAQWTKMVEEK